jgi:molybdate transport system substrate-binding protein
MMRFAGLICSILAGFPALSAVSVQAAEPAERPMVFAAASTAEALSDAAQAFASTGQGEIRLAFGPSSALARQIEEGAPASLFLSADQEWMDYLQTRGLLSEGGRTDLLSNSLVVIAEKGSRLAFGTLGRDSDLLTALGPGRLAIADPAHVPAGRYAREALETLGLWPSVAERLAPALDVRAARAFVESGNAPLGIVYATEALASRRLSVVGLVPPTAHRPIVYPLALIKGHDGPIARAFAAYLRSPEGLGPFLRRGFTRPAP